MIGTIGAIVVVALIAGGCWYLWRWFTGAADLP